jgi:5-methylcytosine-specific restriction endonuclease McrA
MSDPERTPETKTCGKCGLPFAGKFCRPCKTKYTAEHRAANPEQYRLASAKYRANNREKANAKSQRWKQNAPERPCHKCGTLFTGPAGYCKACDKLYKAAWYQANKDKNKPSNVNPEIRRKNKRIAEQRRRARKMAVPDGVSVDIAAKLFAMQKGRCACCKVEFVGTKYELDHIEPLAKGGRHADDNLQLLCMGCNRAKADKDPITFMQQLGFLL